MKNHYAPGTVAGPYKSSSDDSSAYERGHSLIDAALIVLGWIAFIVLGFAFGGFVLAVLGVI